MITSSIGDVFAFYKKLRMVQEHTSILESLGECVEGYSQFCIVGVVPHEVLCVKEGSATVTALPSKTARPIDSWLEVLDDWCVISPDGVTDGPYQTGAIGYIGYDAKYEFEELQKTIASDCEMPVVYFVKYAVLLVHDRKKGTSHWVCDPGFEDRVHYYENLAVAPDSAKPVPFVLRGDIEPCFEEAQYAGAVNKVIEYIYAGDIFQANYTTRFKGKFAGDVINVYEALRVKTPNPFFAFLDFPQPVISTSPERFVQVRGNEARTYPIKGTKPCMVDGVDQAEVLKASAKNQAENIMITDLMRNDLGRVSVQGSVEVEELCRVRRFNQLYHLESVVKGTLLPGTKISNLLAATFPGGSISGAPKIRAMDIIEELEFCRRGPYCGAIGFLGNKGWIDTSIAIRIIYFKDDQLYFHAGGGVVVNSEVLDEYKELVLKAQLIHQNLESFNVMKDVRSLLDQVDQEIFALVKERFRLVQEASCIKKSFDVPVMQANRVKQMIAYRQKQMQELGDISQSLVSDLYKVLIDHAMTVERTHATN